MESNLAYTVAPPPRTRQIQYYVYEALLEDENSPKTWRTVRKLIQENAGRTYTTKQIKKALENGCFRHRFIELKDGKLMKYHVTPRQTYDTLADLADRYAPHPEHYRADRFSVKENSIAQMAKKEFETEHIPVKEASKLTNILPWKLYDAIITGELTSYDGKQHNLPAKKYLNIDELINYSTNTSRQKIKSLAPTTRKIKQKPVKEATVSEDVIDDLIIFSVSREKLSQITLVASLVTAASCIGFFIGTLT